VCVYMSMWMSEYIGICTPRFVYIAKQLYVNIYMDEMCM